MSEFTADQEVVLQIIKEWLRAKDAAFLAREEQVVFWGPIDGNLRKQGWNKLKLKEATSIIRSTQVPVGIMKHCTEDMLRAAAQEEGRTYVCGVTVLSGAVSPEYFNFAAQARSVCEVLEHRAAIFLIAELEALNQNVMWRDLTCMYEKLLTQLGLEIPNSHQRNGFLRYGLQESAFVEKRNSKTFNNRYVIREDGKLRQLICIKLPHKSGIKDNWTAEEMQAVINRAAKALMR